MLFYVKKRSVMAGRVSYACILSCIKKSGIDRDMCVYYTKAYVFV